MVRWLVGSILLLAALAGLVYGVGVVLPREHTVAMRATYDATPGRLYEAVANFYKAPEWRSDLDSVTPLEPVGKRPRWREHGAFGSITYEADVAKPPNRYGARIVDDDLPFGGRWTFEIDSVGYERTALTITERGEIDSPMFRFLSRFVFGQHATMENYLEDLGTALDQEVEPSKVDPKEATPRDPG